MSSGKKKNWCVLAQRAGVRALRAGVRALRTDLQTQRTDILEDIKCLWTKNAIVLSARCVRASSRSAQTPERSAQTHSSTRKRCLCHNWSACNVNHKTVSINERRDYHAHESSVFKCEQFKRKRIVIVCENLSKTFYVFELS